MTLSKAEQKRRQQRDRENERRRLRRAEQKRQQMRPIDAIHSDAPPLLAPSERTYSETEVRSLLQKALTMKDEDYQAEKEPEPPKQSRAERRWEKKKEKLRAQLAAMSDEPADEQKHPITVKEAEEMTRRDTHFIGKKPLQFKKPVPAEPVQPVQAEPKPAPLLLPVGQAPEGKRRLRWRRAKVEKKAKQVFTETIPEALPPKDMPDVVEEQVEKPQTTIHCPESITEDGIKDVKRNPEQYIEINMVTKSRVVDTFYIPSDRKSFHYKTKEYRINEDTIYLLPTRLGLFMPTCHYKEDVLAPWGFKQMNKGITGKALSLLYMEQLYTSLLYSEDVKYNFFIVILSIAILIAYAVGCYFLFVHEGGLFKSPVPLPPIQTIIPWRL